MYTQNNSKTRQREHRRPPDSENRTRTAGMWLCVQHHHTASEEEKINNFQIYWIVNSRSLASKLKQEIQIFILKLLQHKKKCFLRCRYETNFHKYLFSPTRVHLAALLMALWRWTLLGLLSRRVDDKSFVVFSVFHSFEISQNEMRALSRLFRERFKPIL